MNASRAQLMEWRRRDLVAFVKEAPEVRQSGAGMERRQLVETVIAVRDARRRNQVRELCAIPAAEVNEWLRTLPQEIA